MNQHIDRLQTTIEPLRQQIINHKLYSLITDIEDLKIFMQQHVFAVWDFMSLLKSLQNNLTCTQVPWFPKGLAETRYLINEIVVGEECDIDLKGNRRSHFDLYIDAMNQCDANTYQISTFINLLQNGNSLEEAFNSASISDGTKSFVSSTFEINAKI